MSKRQLTTEQAAARDARKAKFRELVKAVAALSEEQKAAFVKKYGARKLDGGEFSLCNQILLATQKPDATIFAGFRQWIKAGRCVRKGERGAMLWVPIGGRKSVDEVTGETQTDTGGDRPGFVMGTVFDISQTEPAGAPGAAAAAVQPAGVIELDFGGRGGAS